jgi:hypothetical protein
VPDGDQGGDIATPIGLFRDAVRPIYKRMVETGRIGAWGITGVEVPSTVNPAPGGSL